MAVCQEAEPRVIDNIMIEKAIFDQGPKGEAGRLAREEGIPWEEVEKLRLEFLKILRIDHVWMLTGLTKLSLSNNLIEKIENLEALVNLKELDLSFNKIEEIENLDALINLETLSLFSNSISVLKNMDHLIHLNIFTIGNNQIKDLDNILYLRRLKQLNSLNLTGNPVSLESNFRLFIAAFLPNLIYYQYKMILESERTEGLHIFSKKMRAYKEIEDVIQAEQDRIEALLAEEALYADSFVEFLGGPQLFDAMFENDPEGTAMANLNEDTIELYTKFKEEFMATTKTLFHFGQEQCQLRQSEVEQFQACVDGAKQSGQLESIEKMEEFLQSKENLESSVKTLQDNCDNGIINMNEYMEKVHDITELFDENIQQTWRHLMSLEITLFEQVEETNGTFEQALTEMINTFIETAQSIFSQCRDLESSYSESNNELIHKALAITDPDAGPTPPILIPIFADKEVLSNSVAASHDMHLQIIDKREDLLIVKARQWLKNLVENLQKNEIKRNRGKVLEINHYLDVIREEYEDLCSLFFYQPASNPNV